MTEEHLLYRVEGGVAYFTINREQQRNAISAVSQDFFLNIWMRPKRTKMSV